MKQRKELTFKCDNHKCMIINIFENNKSEYFTFKTRDWMAQTGYNEEDGTYIYIQEECPKCEIYCKKYYSLSNVFMMLMVEEEIEC